MGGGAPRVSATSIVQYFSGNLGVPGFLIICAAMVELVDTPDSKSCELMLVPVQVRLAVPTIKKLPF